MKRTLTDRHNVVLFFLLLATAVGLRIAFRYLPNFAPIAALAMFAGFYFRSLSIAVALPFLAMLLSDLWIGGYHLGIMAVVYGSLTLPVFFRGPVRRAYGQMIGRGERTDLRRRSLAGLKLGGFGLVGALCFFVCTNVAVWYFSAMYQNTPAEMVRCFANALPFFRYSLLGDLGFGLALFGGYALATSVARVEQWSPVVSPSRAAR